MDTFHIVALGPPTSGKTVYLAALHHVLGERPIGDGISATVEFDEAAKLHKIYQQVVDPQCDWPPNTHGGAEMREFTFRFAVSWTQRRWFRSPLRRTFQMLDISYVDYAGEWMPDADITDPALLKPFKQRVRDAHALLGIIDGIKLLQYLDLSFVVLGGDGSLS